MKRCGIRNARFLKEAMPIHSATSVCVGRRRKMSLEWFTFAFFIFYYMFIYKTALQISLTIDGCEFAKFIGLSLKLLCFNISGASMTPLFKVFHTCAQAEHSISQSPLITLDKAFSILYTPNLFFHSCLLILCFYYHLYGENSPN